MNGIVRLLRLSRSDIVIVALVQAADLAYFVLLVSDETGQVK